MTGGDLIILDRCCTRAAVVWSLQRILRSRSRALYIDRACHVKTDVTRRVELYSRIRPQLQLCTRPPTVTLLYHLSNPHYDLDTVATGSSVFRFYRQCYSECHRIPIRLGCYQAPDYVVQEAERYVRTVRQITLQEIRGDNLLVLRSPRNPFSAQTYLEN